MPRITQRFARAKAKIELQHFLKRRALGYIPNHPSLSADYTLRLLNVFPKDIEALSLGYSIGMVAGQPELSEKCLEAFGPQLLSADGGSASAGGAVSLNLLSFPGVASRLSPEVSAVIASLQSSPMTGALETLHVKSTVELARIQQYLDEAGKGKVANLAMAIDEEADASEPSTSSSGIVKHRRVEVLQPTDAAFGRGLFAAAVLRRGDVVLSEAPALHVNMPPLGKAAACGHCGRPLSEAFQPTAYRTSCSEVAYCSEACETSNYSAGHGPMCFATNDGFAQWARPMQEEYFSTSSTAKDKKASLTMYAVGVACAAATAAQSHPLRYQPFAMLSGQVTYDGPSALAHTGGLAIGLGAALRQEHLYLDDVMSLFALLMDNGFYNEGRGSETVTAPTSIDLYPLISMVNHSCVPNTELVDAPASVQHSVGHHHLVKQLTVLKDVLPGEQLFINYNSKLMGSGRNSLGYEARRELLQQRHIKCTCPKCVLRQ